MLVAVSDWHLTDGTCLATAAAGSVRIFAERLGDLALAASWRTDGRYRPVERIDLVLLGDSLDLLASSRWLNTPARPWHDPRDPAVVEATAGIVGDVLAHNEPLLGMLRLLASDDGLRLPYGDYNGRPIDGSPGQPVPVRIHYMVGDHDRLLHAAGPEYDALRRQVAGHLALSTRTDLPFAHDPQEDEALLEILRAHRVWARHGDVFDPLCGGTEEGEATLEEVLAIELATRFRADIEAELGDQLPPAARAGIAEIGHLRPILLVPAWLDGLLARTCPDAGMRSFLRRRWDETAEACLAMDVAAHGTMARRHDLRDAMARALLFARRPASGWAEKVAAWLSSLRGTSGDSYVVHALAEPEFRNRRARHVVYGHTHHAEIAPLEASHADGYALPQIYFNTGTWRRVYRPTHSPAVEREFVGHETLNLLAFYQGDEREGRRFETWSGTLAVGSAEWPLHRVDSGTGAAAGRLAAGGAPSTPTPVRPPHFSFSSLAGRSAGSRRA
jgi:hypothetical protein